MPRKWLLLIVAGLCARGVAAQDPETTRIPFQAQVKLTFHEAPLGVGVATPVVVTTVPDGSRLVITQVSARCETAPSTTSVGPLTLKVTPPITVLGSVVDHWFPVVSQGNNSFGGYASPNGTGPTYVPIRLWVASSPTHIYATGGRTVTVTASLKPYADLLGAPPLNPPLLAAPFCNATVSGYLVTPTL